MQTTIKIPEGSAPQSERDTQVHPDNVHWYTVLGFLTAKQIPLTLVAILFTILAGLCQPVVSYLVSDVFKSLMEYASGSTKAQHMLQEVSTACLYLTIVGMLVWVFRAISIFSFLLLGELQATALRRNLFRCLLRKKLAWFDLQPDGTAAILPRFHTQINDVQNAVGMASRVIVENLTIFTSSLGLAFSTSWKLVLVTFASLPVSCLLTVALSSKMNPLTQNHQEALKSCSKIASNAIRLIDAVKGFNARKSMTGQYSQSLAESGAWLIKEVRILAWIVAFSHFFCQVIFVQSFWYGSTLVNDGWKDAGEVVRTIWSCLQAAQAASGILPYLMYLKPGQISATVLSNTMKDGGSEETPINTHPDRLQNPKYCEGRVELRSVSFAYPSRPDVPVLKHCSLFFPAGQTTYVVGPSGCGKSTLAFVLLKLYHPGSGVITIDGIPLERLPASWLRQNITLVEQESILFNDTISNNISITGTGVTIEEVLEAVRFAALSGTIDELPSGLNTPLTQGGNSLSGGQCQRIALARARIRNAPVLFLDESTSALDKRTRDSVLQSILTWRRGQTTIIVTHDMEQIRDNDLVYVMNNGKVLQSGRKSELSAYKPLKPTVPPETIIRTKKKPVRHRARHVVSGFRSGVFSAAFSGSFPHPFRAPDLQTDWRPAYSSHERLLSDLELREMHRRNTESLLEGKSQNDKRYGRNDSTVARSDAKSQSRSSQQDPKEYFSLWMLITTVLPALKGRYRVLLLLGIVTTIIHAAATPVFSFFFSRLLRAYEQQDNNSSIALENSLAIIGLGFANLLTTYAQTFSMETVASQWTNKNRVQGFERILLQPKAWFEQDNHSTAFLTVALDKYGEEMRSILGQDLPMMVTAFVMLLIGAIWSMITCPKLALVGLACTPVLFGIASIDMRLTADSTSKYNEATEDIVGTYTEVFLGIRTVKSLQLEQRFINVLDTKARLNIKHGIARALTSAIFGGWNRGSVYFVFALVIYYASKLASNASAQFVSIMLQDVVMLTFTMTSAIAIFDTIPQLSKTQESASRLLRLSSLSESTSDERQGNAAPKTILPIHFSNVRFAYPTRPGAMILRGLNLTIRSNSCTVIAGHSGSGKSTIASLILKLYDIESDTAGNSGKITLDGVKIQDVHTPTLRSLVSIVPQTPMLFPTTVFNNITYGLESASEFYNMRSVESAARAASIHDFISSLPQGYNTFIGENGLGLSCGQAQRIAIARALMRRPSILLLDEATSNLDDKSGAQIRESVRDLLRKNRAETRNQMAVVIITHDSKMMNFADQVFVLNEGKLVEDKTTFATRGRWNGA